MNTENRKKIFTPGRALFLLILAALAVRAAAALTRPMIQLDETAYVRMAQNLAHGRGLLDITGLTATHFSPLPPIMIAALAVVVRDYVLAGYLVVTVFGSLILLPVYLLTREMAGRRAALMAAALMAVMPIFVDYSSLIYTESVYIFFLVMAIFFGWHMLSGRRAACAALAGTALGLAYLCNPSAVFYLVALAALMVITAAVRGGWGRAARGLVLFLLAFGVFAVPYVIFLHGQLGKWTYSGKDPGDIYASEHNLRGNTLAWEADLLSLVNNGRELKINTLAEKDDPASFVLNHPRQAVKNFFNQAQILYDQQLSKVMPLWLLPLLGLGLFARGWDRRRAAQVGYLLLMMGPALVILAMYAHDRFFMPFVPLAVVWVAQGWERLQAWGGESIRASFSGAWRTRLNSWLPWLLAAVVLAPLLAYSALTVKKQSYDLQFRQAGELIEQRAGAGRRIMSREYSSSFYAGGTMVALPYADYRRTTAFARLKGVDFLVVARGDIPAARPGLAPLLDVPASHADWRLFADLYPGTGRETLIFRLVR